MGGYSFGANETDAKTKSKSAVSLKGKNKSKEQEQNDEEGEDQLFQKGNNNQSKRQQNNIGTQISSQLTDVTQAITQQDNPFMSFTQVNEIDINDFQQENLIFQDNHQGDFNHDLYHYCIQDKLKQKEYEYFQKLSLDFYTQQRIPQNEYNDLKQMLHRQKEILEKQPCVNVNSLLNFEKKLNQLERLWEEIKVELKNSQTKQSKQEQLFQNNKSYSKIGTQQQRNIEGSENCNFKYINQNEYGQDYMEYNDDNSYEKENNKYNENNNIKYLKQNQSGNSKNSQKIVYQFIKPNKKVGGVKTEHSPQNFRESPYQANHNNNINQNGNNLNSRQPNIQSTSHSPKSRSNPQKPMNHNGVQIQRMYAPFNISKSNQQINGYQKNQNDPAQYSRIKSTATRDYSPSSRPINNSSIKAVKISDNSTNMGNMSKEQRGGQSTAQTQDSLNYGNEIGNKKFVQAQRYQDSENLLYTQKVKIIQREVNTNNTLNRSASPNNGRMIAKDNQIQRTNFLVNKTSSSSNNVNNKNKQLNNSSPIKKESNQFFRITSSKKQSNEQVQKSPQQEANNKSIKVASNIQSTKKRPNSPHNNQRFKKLEQQNN
ncbi:hypothetical protein ABPG74_017458 [Tetrahymena malaccensis]